MGVYISTDNKLITSNSNEAYVEIDRMFFNAGTNVVKDSSNNLAGIGSGLYWI